MKSFFFRLSLVAMIACIAMAGVGIGSIEDTYLSESVAVSSSDVSVCCEDSSPFVTREFEHTGENTCRITYRLFGVFKIRETEVLVTNGEYVYLGGMPLGIEVNLGGMMIGGMQEVVTLDGNVLPSRGADIKTGDVLTHINGRKIEGISDVIRELRNNNGEPVKLTLIREDISFDVVITPAKDILTGDRKLGLYLRDSIKGIGTLTYIASDTVSYGALGHAIGEEMLSGETVNGEIYPAVIFGVKKSEGRTAGELMGGFLGEDSIGSIDRNNAFGIFGSIVPEASRELMRIPIGGMHTAHVGRAHIYTTVNENYAQRYEIEIVKTNYQRTPDAKGMVIRITDEELLSVTGGIVQGMSGSPIVQDGRIVGAVSHVFVGDSLRGYGMYIDWMLDSK